MQIIVQKYGGTSLGSIERINRVADNIARAIANNKFGLVVVVSAMAGQTDSLFSLAAGVGKHLPSREMDSLVATGEQVSVSLLTIALKNKGVDAKGFCGWQIPIVTTDDFNGARIKRIVDDKILTELKQRQVIVIAGFQGVSESGDITTLGRGGSDTSAVGVAVSLNAVECQIFTDVNGVYNADPNKITNAKRIDKIDGKIMLEMASLGAKVLHVRSCELAYRYSLNIRVLSSFAPQDQGSLVMNNGELEHYPVISLSVEEQQTLFIMNRHDQEVRLNTFIARLHGLCNIDMLNIFDNHRVAFSISYTNYDKVNQFLTTHRLDYAVTNNLTKLSLIGSGFRSNNNLNQTIWQLLEDVEVFSFAHSELSMSILVHSSDVTRVRNKFSQLL